MPDTGRSGVDYVFDILCYNDINNFGYSVAIDFWIVRLRLIWIRSLFLIPRLLTVALIIKYWWLSLNLITPPKICHPAAYSYLSDEKRNRRASKAKQPADRCAVKSPVSRSVPLFSQFEAINLIPEVVARRYNAIPLAVSGDTLEVAMDDPTSMIALEALATISQKKIKT